MNLLSKRTLTTVGLLLSMSLVSCEKGSELIRPDENQSSNTTPRPTDTTPTTNPITGPVGGVLLANKKYILDQYAYWQLVYDAQGNLVKLQSLLYPALTREYIRASNGSGITILDFEGITLKTKTLIVLDAKGRCKDSYVANYGFQNGNPTTNVARFSYKYNATNQLEEIRDQDNSKRYDQFQYNPDGNLRQVQHYNNGLKQRTTYYYDYPGQAAIVDKNHLSPLWMPHYNQVDEFLPIYGKFNNHLVWRLEYTDAVTNVNLDQVTYLYKLNNAGYIDDRENTRVTAGQTLKETYVFGYK